MKRWRPGDKIEVREVWNGRTWEVRYGYVIEDSQEAIALYTPAATPAVIAVGPDGRRLRLPTDDWSLADSAIPDNRHYIGVHPWRTAHSVLLIYDDSWTFLCWYINLESDSRRTARGIEYQDHFLDIVVLGEAMDSWRWKDEEELSEAVELGLVSAEQATEFRAEGERALEWLRGRRPPYDRRWEEWRPPVDWGSSGLAGLPG